MIIHIGKERYFADDKIFKDIEKDLIPYDLWELQQKGETRESIETQRQQIRAKSVSTDNVLPELLPFIEQHNKFLIDEEIQLNEKLEVFDKWQPLR